MLVAIPASVPAQSIIAYEIAPGTVGAQPHGGALGMDFIVNGNITVDDLGAFDSGGDGIMLPITVELWSRNDGGTPLDPADDFGISVLAMANFAPGDDGTLVDGSRFKALAAPLDLAAGAYTISAYGYGDTELNFNSSGSMAPELATTDSLAITFVGTSRFGDPLDNGQFPASLDDGPVNRYGSGTFAFTAEDSDDDGMPDVWEELFGLDKNNPDDAGEDTLDMDGLTNLQEFENGSDPTDADSDDDNLTDGDEVNITETDPADADSDDDNLTDDVETDTGVFMSETDTGTDPNDPDSDDDTFGDGTEVSAGTDPNDDTSFPEFQFGGTIAYDIPEGALGNQNFGTGLGMDFDVGDNPIRVTAYGVFDDASDGIGAGVTLSVSLWERDPVDNTASLGQVGPTVEFTDGQTGELIGGSRFKLLDEPIELSAGFQGSIVAYGFQGATDQNGNDGGVGNFPYATDDGEGLITFVGTSRFGGGGVGTYPNSLDGGPVNRYGAGTFIYDTGPSAPFAITDVTFDREAGEASITWNSRLGRFYAIDASDDLILWGELDDSQEAQGESTTFIETGISPATRNRYYRVRAEISP